MQEIISDYLAQLKIGRKQSYKNLTVYPLLSAYSAALDYLLLDEALAQHLIEVKEVNEGGAVPELKAINRSPLMVLILDGEELVGAKQNRIVNTTILIQGNTTIVIPVSCVEQGRWRYRTPMFFSEHRVMSPSLRAEKSEQVHYSLRSSGAYRADQGAIWEGIAEKATRRGAVSPSMAMSEIYEKDRPSLAEYAKHFRSVDSQVGAVFLINGKVVGIDALGKAESFSKIFKKLVESYALDAVDWFEPEKEHKALKSDVTRFLKVSGAAHVEAHPSVGLGTDCRMESKKTTGFALAHEDQVLHLCVFARDDRQGGRMQTGRMERYTRRMRGHNSVG